MESFEGHIVYNEQLKKYGVMGESGWIREKLQEGDHIAILIGDRWLHANAKTAGSYSYLLPHEIDYEKIKNHPIVYFTHDEEPFKKKTNNVLAGLLMAAGSVLLPAAIAALLSLSGTNFLTAFFSLYGMFGFGCTIAGLLCIISPKMEEKNVTFGFGIAIHYASAITSKIISSIMTIEETGCFIISLVLVSLISYIIWDKHFK